MISQCRTQNHNEGGQDSRSRAVYSHEDNGRPSGRVDPSKVSRSGRPPVPALIVCPSAVRGSRPFQRLAAQKARIVPPDELPHRSSLAFRIPKGDTLRTTPLLYDPMLRAVLGNSPQLMRLVTEVQTSPCRRKYRFVRPESSTRLKAVVKVDGQNGIDFEDVQIILYVFLFFGKSRLERGIGANRTAGA